ncbi:hypothetical protein, partial [Kaistella sp.]|uniref:hypothetical protein n=1 Tax=Kaistella sp. TaxID=2782235 RepID=UPI002F95833B
RTRRPPNLFRKINLQKLRTQIILNIFRRIKVEILPLSAVMTDFIELICQICGICENNPII